MPKPVQPPFYKRTGCLIAMATPFILWFLLLLIVQ